MHTLHTQHTQCIHADNMNMAYTADKLVTEICGWKVA